MGRQPDDCDTAFFDQLNARLERDYHREPAARRRLPALASRGTLRTLIEQRDAAKGAA